MKFQHTFFDYRW